MQGEPGSLSGRLMASKMKLSFFLRRISRGGDWIAPADSFSPPFAFIYIFNLIVAFGVLALPLGFSQAGLIISTILMVILCFLAYITATYVIEAMSVANALQRHRKRTDQATPELQKGNASVSSANIKKEKTRLSPTQPGDIDPFEITVKFEMAEMATLFFNKVGLVVFYICKCLYLYGDLAIYAIGVPKSVATAVCNGTPKQFINTSVPCDTTNDTMYYEDTFTGSPNTSNNTTDTCAVPHYTEIYYIFLVVFIVLIGPFSFFNIQRTMILQLITIVLRNITFAIMIILAIVHIAMGLNKGVSPSPVKFGGFPVLFGTSVYAFMCHHSLPGTVTPMTTKRHLYKLLLVEFLVILVLYLLLAYTAVFRFAVLQDLYTLNFFPPNSKTPAVLSYFIVLSPVFTLATNFPIISVTLRETVKELFHTFRKGKRYHFLIEYIVFPLIAIVPPFVIAFCIQDEEPVIAITGSLPGVGMQYVIPVFLAFLARRKAKKELGSYNNKHHSIVNNNVIVVLILIWSAICIVVALITQILKVAVYPTLRKPVCINVNVSMMDAAEL